MMRLCVVAAVAALAAVAAGYGTNRHSGQSRNVGGCSPGSWGCAGGISAPGVGGGQVASGGGVKKVVSVGVSGGYWWQNNNPFVGAGNRPPSAGGQGGFPSSGWSKPVVGGVGGRPVSGTKFPGSFPSVQQPISNNIVGPMGICPRDFVCVHWQLCRNGQVIIDGTGIIDKSKRKPLGQNNLKGCGGDMVCCGVTPGYTVPGVISTLTSQQSGSSHSQANTDSNLHLPDIGTPFVNTPSLPQDFHRDSGILHLGANEQPINEVSSSFGGHGELPANDVKSNLASSSYPSTATTFENENSNVPTSSVGAHSNSDLNPSEYPQNFASSSDGISVLSVDSETSSAATGTNKNFQDSNLSLNEGTFSSTSFEFPSHHSNVNQPAHLKETNPSPNYDKKAGSLSDTGSFLLNPKKHVPSDSSVSTSSGLVSGSSFSSSLQHDQSSISEQNSEGSQYDAVTTDEHSPGRTDFVSEGFKIDGTDFSRDKAHLATFPQLKVENENAKEETSLLFKQKQTSHSVGFEISSANIEHGISGLESNPSQFSAPEGTVPASSLSLNPSNFDGINKYLPPFETSSARFPDSAISPELNNLPISPVGTGFDGEIKVITSNLGSPSLSDQSATGSSIQVNDGLTSNAFSSSYQITDSAQKIPNEASSNKKTEPSQSFSVPNEVPSKPTRTNIFDTIAQVEEVELPSSPFGLETPSLTDGHILPNVSGEEDTSANTGVGVSSFVVPGDDSASGNFSPVPESSIRVTQPETPKQIESVQINIDSVTGIGINPTGFAEDTSKQIVLHTKESSLESHPDDFPSLVGSAFGNIPAPQGGYLPPIENFPVTSSEPFKANLLDQQALISGLNEAFHGEGQNVQSDALQEQSSQAYSSIKSDATPEELPAAIGAQSITLNENISPSGGAFGGSFTQSRPADSVGSHSTSSSSSFANNLASSSGIKSTGSQTGGYSPSGSSGSQSFSQGTQSASGTIGFSGSGSGKPSSHGNIGAFGSASSGSSFGQTGNIGHVSSPGSSFPKGSLGSAGSFSSTGSVGGGYSQTGSGAHPSTSPLASGNFGSPSSTGGIKSTGGSYSQSGITSSSCSQGSLGPCGSFGSPSSPGSVGSGGSPASSGSYGSPGSSDIQGTPGSFGSPGGSPSSPGSSDFSGSSGSPGNLASPGSYGSSGSAGIKGSFESSSSPSGSGSPGSFGSPSSPSGSGSLGSFGSASSSGSYGSSASPGSPGSPGGFGSPGSSGSPGSPGAFGSLGSSGSPGSAGGYGSPASVGGYGSSGSSSSPGSSGSFGSPGSPGSPGSSSSFGSSGGGNYQQPSGGGQLTPSGSASNPSMAGMMSGMMGMGGSPFVAGTCSAGTYCVPSFQCNPYNGFIIMDPKQLQAVWPDAPQVPLLDCFIPAGVLDGGVCCQQNHPIVGPNGQILD